ncbi:MAG: hypothetical protein QM811_16560 [Pirellulales bacterium]
MERIVIEGITFEVGKPARFEYRNNPYPIGVSKWEQRTVVVTRIRDLLAEPLSLLTIALDPFRMRGRYAVYGEDYERGGKPRQFYDIHIRQPKHVTKPLQVVLIDETGESDAEIALLTDSRTEAESFCEAWREGQGGDFPLKPIILAA